MSMLAAAGSVVSGIAAIQGGNAAAAGYRAEANARAEELKRDSEMTKIAAQQSQAAALEDLQRTTGTIRATLASRSLDLSSPSAMALEGAASMYARRDIMRTNFNAGQQIGANNQAGRTAQAMASFKGKIARNAGYMAGASSFLKAAGEVSSSFSGMGKGK
jgi:hypothetical protein